MGQKWGIQTFLCSPPTQLRGSLLLQIYHLWVVSWWPVMINEKLPPYFLQGGHPTLRQLAARSAQPVNWSGRLLLIAPPLGTIRVHFQRIFSLFSAFTPSWSSYNRAGPRITPWRQFWGLKIVRGGSEDPICEPRRTPGSPRRSPRCRRQAGGWVLLRPGL